MMACTAEEWTAIHVALVREAKKGSAAHIKLLAEYNFAKPAENLVVQSTGTQEVTHKVCDPIAFNAATDDKAQLVDLIAARARRNGCPSNS